VATEFDNRDSFVCYEIVTSQGQSRGIEHKPVQELSRQNMRSFGNPILCVALTTLLCQPLYQVTYSELLQMRALSTDVLLLTTCKRLMSDC
jgi:hypothetical protein